MRLSDENLQADQCLPPAQLDGSGIGVNYTDAYIKPFNTQLDDGTKVTCKRKGLKIMLSIGDRKGEALMCKRQHGPDPKQILHQALVEAAADAGAAFTVDEGAVYLENT